MTVSKTKEDRIYDEAIYTRVAEEIESNTMHKGLWAKALAESAGDPELQKSLYIKFRVQSLKDGVDTVKQTDRNTKRRTQLKRIERIMFYTIVFVIFISVLYSLLI